MDPIAAEALTPETAAAAVAPKTEIPPITPDPEKEALAATADAGLMTKLDQLIDLLTGMTEGPTSGAELVTPSVAADLETNHEPDTVEISLNEGADLPEAETNQPQTQEPKTSRRSLFGRR